MIKVFSKKDVTDVSLMGEQDFYTPTFQFCFIYLPSPGMAVLNSMPKTGGNENKDK